MGKSILKIITIVNEEREPAMTLSQEPPEMI